MPRYKSFKQQQIDALKEKVNDLTVDLKRLEAVIHGSTYRPEDGMASRLCKAEEYIRADQGLGCIPDYEHFITTCTIRKYDDDGNVKSEKPGWSWQARADDSVIGSGKEKTIEEAQAAVKAAVQEHFWKWLCDTTKQPSVGERKSTKSWFDTLDSSIFKYTTVTV